MLCNVSLSAQQIYVPDDNFEQALIDLGYDSGPLDDSVLTSSIRKIDSLIIRKKKISSFQGIEDFTALTYLNCFKNQLISIDVSSNIALTYLECKDNQLTSLNISSNTALTHLDCIENQLTSLDVRNGNNNELEFFEAENNPNLTCIYVDDKNADYLSEWKKDESSSFCE